MKVGYWNISDDEFRAILAKEDVSLDDLNREAFDILMEQSLGDQSLPGGDPWRYGVEFHTLRVIREMKKLNIVTGCDAETIMKLRRPTPESVQRDEYYIDFEDDEDEEDVDVDGDVDDDYLVYSGVSKKNPGNGTPSRHDSYKEPTFQEMVEYMNTPKDALPPHRKMPETHFTPISADDRAKNARIIGWLALIIASLSVVCGLLYANDLISPRATSIFPIAAFVAVQRIATKYHSRFSSRFNLARLAVCVALLFSSAAYFVIKGIYLALCSVLGSIATTPFALVMMGLFLVLKVVCVVLIDKTTDSRRGIVIGWLQSLAVTMLLASFVFGAMQQ